MVDMSPIEPPHATRPAVAQDLPALRDMLTRAFLDDPVARWSCPSSDTALAGVLARFHGAQLRRMLRAGEIWTTADRSSAAVWARPGAWRSGVRHELELASSIVTRRTLVRPWLLARSPMVGWGLTSIERRHPQRPPHWYLAILGTDPARQGEGLGSAVLRPVLGRCDSDGVCAYLECSKERNVDFYARFGFRVTAELRLPRGPRVWAMWREA